MSKEIGEEYLSSLQDLNVNSKPLINMLTILAEENIQHAPVIVEAIEQHLAKVNPDVKLPVLYLVDSIVKNVGGEYKTLFSQCLVKMFCGVFEKVNERIREKLFALRQTWADVFPQSKLCKLDIKVAEIDPGWPIISQASSKSPAIHVNPNFFKTKDPVLPQVAEDVQVQLREKQRKLLELQRKKLELELVATKKEIEKQEREITNLAGQSSAVVLPEAVINVPALSTKTVSSRSLITTNHPNIIPQISSTQDRNFPPQKVRVAPVNPSLVNSLGHSRDPRLARKQLLLQQQGHLNLQNNIVNFNRNNKNDNLNSNVINSDNNNENNVNNSVQLSNANNFLNDTSSVVPSVKLNINKPILPKIPKFSKQSNTSNNSKQITSNSATADNVKCDYPNKKFSNNNDGNNKSSPSKSSSTKSKSKFDSSSKRSNKSRDKNSGSHGHSSDERKKSKGRSSSPLDRDRERRRERSPKAGTHEKTKRGSKSPTPTHSSNSNKQFNVSPSNTKFKEIKQSTKSRNYIRRNRDTSRSPSPQTRNSPKTQDIDLRVVSPGSKKFKSNTIENSSNISSTLQNMKDHTVDADSEKQESRFKQDDLTDEAIIIHQAASKDVDLRQLNQNNIGVSLSGSSPDIKKRHLLPGEHEEPQVKKTKTEKLDELFGSEDVDLRQINPTTLKSDLIGSRPITPPPPVISNETDNTCWAKIKGDVNKKPTTPRSNLELVRAKLSEVSKKSKSDIKSLDLRPSGGSSSIEKDKKKFDTMQTDESSQDGNDANIKIMMAQAQEQLNNKSIDMEEYGTMIKQIFVINESKKIREAERREYIKHNTDPWQQVDLTPISEDEIGFSSPSDEDEESKKLRHERKQKYNLKKKAEALEKLQSINSSLVQPLSVESSFAQSTAAELRNTIENNKDGRWQKTKFENNNLRWKSPWEQSNPTPTPLIQSTNIPNTWNIDFGLVNTTTQNKPLPFVNNTITNPWQNIPFTQNQIIPTISQQPTLADLINQNDLVRTINIDQIPREIRFYDDIAIAFMNWDEPKEIGFQSGKRRVIVDDKDTIILGFNEPNKTFLIDGKSYEIRFGSPTRELYIDNKWYECFFGDPPIGIPLDGKVRVFNVDGPPPPVKIGNLRQDLVVGKINLIIDARNMVPVFLDSKIQYFEIDGQINTLQFADYLLTVLINSEPFNVEFGGLPKSLYVRGKKHFVRFTALPIGIIPGKVFIKGMVRTNMHRDLTSPPAPAIVSLNDVPQPDFIQNEKPEKMLIDAPAIAVSNSLSNTMNILSSMLPQPISKTLDSIEQTPIISTSSATAHTLDTNSSNVLNNINIDDLYQKLLASGILSKPVAVGTPKEDKRPKEKEKIIPVDLTKTDTIKTRQSAIVNQLFSGMQCSSCGVRFPPEQTMKYSQHLDWHFRQNRRDRDSARRAHSRKWYYDVADWIQYEEIEDLEEREKNWFENQQSEIELHQEESFQKADSPPLSCPAGPNDVDKICYMCHDRFEQFYNEETEEWHLRGAIKVDEKTYHPLCYEDYKTSLTMDESADFSNKKLKDDVEIKDDDNKSEVQVKIEKSDNESSSKKIGEDDDDDIVEVIPIEPVVTEILDEEEDLPVESNVNDDTKKVSTNDSVGNESDVEIQEPNIPVTDLDDIDDQLNNTNNEFVLEESGDSSVPFTMVKIKEEPKDDDEIDEEDAFEDVGTVCTDLTNDDSIMNVIDSNAELQQNSSANDINNVKENVQVSSNKIKINITKSLCKPVTNHSTIPTITTTTSNEKHIETASDASKTSNSSEEKEEIEFVFKENLKDVNFTKIDMIKSGYETSGLCTIM